MEGIWANRDAHLRHVLRRRVFEITLRRSTFENLAGDIFEILYILPDPPPILRKRQ